jgi:hypothetical protein
MSFADRAIRAGWVALGISAFSMAAALFFTAAPICWAAGMFNRIGDACKRRLEDRP